MAQAVFVQDGDKLDYMNATDKPIAYRDVVTLANRIGVSSEVIAPGESGTVELTGVYELSADNAAAFVTGDILYWVVADQKLVKTKTGNIYAGMCFADKSQAAARAVVKIG